MLKLFLILALGIAFISIIVFLYRLAESFQMKRKDKIYKSYKENAQMSATCKTICKRNKDLTYGFNAPEEYKNENCKGK